MAVKKIEILNKHQNPATNENEFDIENYMNVNWDKIKEVVDNNADELTTTQGKVTTLETDNKKNKQDISDIKTEQESQNDLLQRTQNALINITTPKSSNINVKDSSDLNAKIDVFGISKQETREGYNLFNNTKTISNVTYNSEEDKWIFNLTGRYDHIASKGDFFEDIKVNTNYTIYLNILKNTTNSIITFNSGNTIWNTSFNIQAGQTGIVISNIKTKEDLSSALYDLWFSHTNTITGEFEVQIMLVEGTFTSENIPDYEQYGASPSPEYPSDIENVTGNIDITICNKNLCYEAKLGNTDNIEFYFNPKAISKQFSISFICNVSLNNNSLYYVVNKVQKTRIAQITSNANSKTIQEVTLTDEIYSEIKNSSEAYFLLYKSNAGFTVPSEAMIENVGSSGEYEEHKEEQTITFPLAEGQRLMDRDKFASDGIHHVRKQIELNGTENIFLENSTLTNVKRFYIRNIGGYVNPNYKGLCSHFKYIANYSLDEEHVYVTTAGFLYIFANFNSVDELKEYLAEQKANGTPVIVEYELAEEEIEAYTEEQQEAYDKLQNVLSYYNETNVFADKAQLVFKYIADTQTWVVNLVKNEVANTNKQLLEIAGGN